MVDLDLLWNYDASIDYWTDDELESITENFRKKDSESQLLSFLSNNIDFEKKSTHKITANIATQPDRYESLLCVLNSIESQFDEIRLYLNGYDQVPDKLKKYTTHIGKDLTDNGKFFWSANDNEYYFTLDDDIIYPKDYVEKTLPKIKNNIVTYHGRTLIFFNKSYYNNQKIWRFEQELVNDELIDVPGTGVMAFDSSLWKPTLWKSNNFKMTDLLVGLEASLYKIPIYCLSKKTGWLKSIDNFGIWHTSHLSDDEQTKISNMIQINRGIYNFDESPLFLSGKSVTDFISYVSKFNYSNYIQFGYGDGKMILQIADSEIFDKTKVIDSSIKKQELSHKMSIFFNLSLDFHQKSLIEHVVNKRSVVFINDYCLPSYYSTKIWHNTEKECLIFCHHMVHNQMPIDKIHLQFNNGDLITYYVYHKV